MIEANSFSISSCLFVLCYLVVAGGHNAFLRFRCSMLEWYSNHIHWQVLVHFLGGVFGI